MKNLGLLTKSKTSQIVHSGDTLAIALRHICAILFLLFTVGIGNTWAETIPAGTIIYVDVANFHSDKSGYAEGYYMSVTSSGNVTKQINKSDVSGAGWKTYDLSGDAEWQTLKKISGTLYAGKVTSASSTGSVSFWRRNASGWESLWDIDVSTPNMWDSSKRKFTITSGYTHHDDRHVAGFSTETSSIELYTPGKKLYLKVNDNWKEGTPRFAACFGGYTGQTWVDCSRLGETDYYSVTIPEGEWPYVIFCRMNGATSENNWDNKWDQTNDLFCESNKNLCVIDGWSYSQHTSQYAPNGAIHGSMNSWVMMSFNSFNGDGELKLELGANTAYEFQVISDESWYGYGDTNYKHTLVGQTAETTLSTGDKDILILTADAGEYTFNWDKSSHELSVTYPNLPNSTNLNPNYVYVKNTSNWSPVNAHLWGGYNGTVWDNDPALSTVTFNSATYYYAATGYETSVIFGQGVNDSHKTGDLTVSEGKGKYYDPSSSSWKWFSSRITLNNQSATSAGTEYKDAELFNTALTTKITCPGKTGYLFGGYFTATGGGGVQIIEDDGDWIASVSGYTNSSTQWVRANTELFAKWTPIVYSIRYNTNGGDGGSMSNSSHTYDVAKALTSNGFTKTGYSFAGWATSAGGTVAYSNGQSVSNLSSTDGATVDLFAKWTANPYTISLNNHDATSAGTSSVSVTFDANTNLTSAITIPKKTGYGFHGYYTGEGGTGTQIIDAEGNFIAGAGSNAYLDGSKNWKHADNITLHAYWVASAVTTPTVTASMPAYIGEDITITLSATSTNVAEPVVIFYVTDNSVSKTYEVVATPGAIGDAPSYSTTHTATFKTDHPATYSVTAEVYSGKLIDNFDGLSAHWKALGNGSFNASATNPAIQAANGSNTVMKITRGDANWKTVQTKKAANDETTTDWNLNYGYIYMSMYSTTARTPKIKYTDDDGGREVKLADNSLSANTWTRKQFPKAADDSQIDFILPFIEENTGDILYIDDIILSNESSMTAQATSSSASTTITQPTIGSCTAEAATTNWGGSNINISLSAQTTYLADAVVVFFVTDGSNSTTYEVTATPGTPGANNAITHTATFVAQHAATYSVTAKLYNGKFIDNFEGSASAWSGLGYGTCERVSNVEREADNGSTKVMKITRSVEEGYGEAHQTAWTTTAENNGTKTSWGHEYGYIHMRYYAPQAETPEVEYWDDGISVFRNTTLSSQTASTWHELVFAVNGGVVNYIHPFVLSGGKTDGHYIYIDDIILSNRSTWAPIKNTSGVDLTADASDVTIREDYTVTFENLSADAGHKGSLDTTVTYGSTTNMGPIEKPSKTHYDFGGYWTSSNSGSTLTTQLIDEDGYWIKDVSGYTSHSGDDATWVYANDITLYAKWTDHEYSITLNTNGGTINSGNVTSYIYGTGATLPTDVTRAGYHFMGWRDNDGLTGDEVTAISSSDSGDKEYWAKWEVRYGLYGSLDSDDTEGAGMPGWAEKGHEPRLFEYSEGTYTITCDLTAPNTTYKFRIVDRIDNVSWGLAAKAVIPANTATTLGSTTADAQLATAGKGTYTLTVVEDGSPAHPRVTITNPTSYVVTLGVKSITYEGEEGTIGSIVAQDAAGNEYANGSYIAKGETVTIVATPRADYDSVGLWSSSAYSDDPMGYSSWTVTENVNAYAKFTEKTNTFEGDVEGHLTEWNQTGNWSAGHVPTINEVVILPKPISVEIAYAVAKRIIIDQSDSKTGKLTIQANKGLELAGTITRTTDGSSYGPTREQDLVLESSTAGNASLIFDNSNSAQATVQMYSKASISGKTWNWQYVGTPFTGSIPQYNYYGSWMYKWNGGWEVVHGNDELTPFVGYCLTQESATTHVMGGTLVSTTSKSVTMAAKTDMVLANSWTAPIYIDAFTTEGEGATFTSEPATIYLFNTGMDSTGTGGEGTEPGTYVVLPVHSATSFGVEFIPSMQGFFVTTNGDGGKAGTITMKYDSLVRSNAYRRAGSVAPITSGQMYAPRRAKAADAKPEVMKIRANGAQYSDRVVILERADFSQGFDNGWDGKKMSFGSESPSVYVINEQGGYDAVSAIPTFEGTVVGFRAGTNNSCTMSFEYDGDETLYLNDLQAQQSTLISEENSYTFTTSANDSEVRFIISATPIKKITTGIENGELLNGANGVRKVLINDHIYIIRSGRIYSVDGAMIK